MEKVYDSYTKKYNNIFGIVFNVGTIILGDPLSVYKIAFKRCSKLQWNI